MFSFDTQNGGNLYFYLHDMCIMTRNVIDWAIKMVEIFNFTDMACNDKNFYQLNYQNGRNLQFYWHGM
jgi:hypothetical protein